MTTMVTQSAYNFIPLTIYCQTVEPVELDHTIEKITRSLERLISLNRKLYLQTKKFLVETERTEQVTKSKEKREGEKMAESF